MNKLAALPLVAVMACATPGTRSDFEVDFARSRIAGELHSQLGIKREGLQPDGSSVVCKKMVLSRRGEHWKEHARGMAIFAELDAAKELFESMRRQVHDFDEQFDKKCIQDKNTVSILQDSFPVDEERQAFGVCAQVKPPKNFDDCRKMKK